MAMPRSITVVHASLSRVFNKTITRIPNSGTYNHQGMPYRPRIIKACIRPQHTLPPPPRAQEPAMFDRGTRGWFLGTKIRPLDQGLVLGHDRGQPRRKKMHAPSAFPQLTTLTSEHQRTESQLTGL